MNPNPKPPLGELTAEAFLRDSWQKTPLLIPQAFPGFCSPIEADELAGLACREDVLSRLILEKGGDYPWQVRPGPLSEEDFEQLGDSHWTVLVQEVDRHVPEVADLFDLFDFLPQWRKDDVMVSFASTHAGVGPHIDSYDVFLLQGSGRRRWEIGPPGDYSMKEGLDLKMLEHFEAEQVFELQPGDMLYLPPGIPHNGVALEPCLTFSFGFLAPTQAEILSDFGLWYEERIGVSRYSDPDLLVNRHPGLIDDSDLNRLLRLLREGPVERELLAEWFGGFITRPPRYPLQTEEFEGEFSDFMADFENAGYWRRHEGVRVIGWLGEKPRLFVEGQIWEEPLKEKTIEVFTENRTLNFGSVASNNELQKLLYDFTKRGWGYFPESDDHL